MVPMLLAVDSAADVNAGDLGEMPQPAGGGMPVYPGSPVVEQDRPCGAGRRWSGRWHDRLLAGAG
jgi:hypothetical protein